MDAPPAAEEAGAARRCMLCPEGKPPVSAGNLGDLIGPLNAGSGAYQACWVHSTCAEWCPEVFWEEDQLRNVTAAIRRGR